MRPGEWRSDVLTAPVTLTGLFSGVQVDMEDQPGLLHESLLTLQALERPLARVHTAERGEVRGTPAELATVLALEGPLAAVDGLAAHQVGGLQEELPADRALVLAPAHL